ncbi:MAG: DUF805 domain-containing protein [Anaerolineaceae bacterium]|nr:DUF805 domain-containing protein [Anaerolineaceae bacterium]
MEILELFKSCIRKYVKFDGRARRKEYWYFALFNTVVMSILGLLAVLFGASESGETIASIFLGLIVLYDVFIFLPSLAVTVRRLHDVGKSGAAIFVSLIPGVGEVILLIWLIEDSAYGTNQYGENPKNLMPEWQRNLNQGNTPQVQQNKPQGNVPLPNNPVPGNKPQISANPYGNQSAQTYPVNNLSVAINAVCVRGSLEGKSVSGPFLYIGRDPSKCQMVYPDNEPGVSRVHCMLRLKGNTIELVDMNSSNGTFLMNGYRLTPNVPVALRSGDSFYIALPTNTITVRIS